MNLPDEVKEYWGFYLLKGSHVGLSVCSRYEGASFIIVKSLKDARRCAFLGELNSSEESDENSDSDEFEFIKDGHPPDVYPSNRPDYPSPDPDVETTVAPMTASGEMMQTFMSK